MLGTALAVAALPVACDDPRADLTPSPAPTPTTAASPAHTLTGVPVAVEPSRAQTPTSSNSGPMPTPIQGSPPSSPTAAAPVAVPSSTPGVQLTDTPTPVAVPTPPATATSEPSLEARIDNLFADYRDNAPFDEHLRKLSDYQSPTPAALSSFETLAAHARQDFELTKRAVIAAGFLGLDSSEANLAIDAYLKHQQKYGLQDPTGFASVTDLILFQNHLNTPGTIELPDGSEEDRRNHILSNEERMETLIAAADIWSWLALPENRGLQTTPDWYERSYPGRGLHQQIVGGLPFSLNASTDIRFSAAPVFTDDEALRASESAGAYRDFEGYNSLTEVRYQHLHMLEIQPNATAKDLEALATGALNNTGLYFSFEPAYADIATGKLDFLIAYKSDIVPDLDVRSRAFMDDTGVLEIGGDGGVFSKDRFRRYSDVTDAGAFRALGVYDPNTDKTIFPRPDNKDIVLYVTGRECRVNVFEHLERFDPEGFGIMSVRHRARDPQGEYGDVYAVSVLEGGTILTFGEPKMAVMLPLQYPFVDAGKTKRLWEIDMRSFAPGGSYGVGFMFNAAAFDEGFNKDPLYANDPAAQNRGPWIKVFDNRADAPEQ